MFFTNSHPHIGHTICLLNYRDFTAGVKTDSRYVAGGEQGGKNADRTCWNYRLPLLVFKGIFSGKGKESVFVFCDSTGDFSGSRAAVQGD
jgi:hypothetical protein